MKYLALFAVILLASSSVHSQGPAGDEILFTPGLPEQPSFKQYSGFLEAGNNRKFFYWFVASQGSPEKDPLMLWLDGGPGCSALVSFFKEHGPFRIASTGKTLSVNPFSWNKIANMLFLEAPAGVGFSHDPAGNYSSNDDSTTANIYEALLDFFKKFSGLQNNDFYVAGKGSASTYVTMLAYRLLAEPKGIKLKGYAIGNGALDFHSNGNSLILFGQYHGLYDLSLWNQLLSLCCNGSASVETCSFVEPPFVSLECANVVQQAAHIIIEMGLNNYDIYGECAGWRQDRRTSTSNIRARQKQTGVSAIAHEHLLQSLNISRPKKFGKNPACVRNDDVATYLNQPQVRKAVHAAESPLLWTSCSDALFYETQYLTLRDVIKKLVDTGHLKALFYNGDTDLTFNAVGNQWFLDSLGYEIMSDYKPWKMHDQVAGFHTTYAGNISFVTIKGAGHMAAQSKAEEALAVISSLLKNEAL
ncbi:lysosomal protective protein-like [Haemaphysalis longicornis]